MSTTRDSSSHTVRPGSTWRAHKAFFAFVFAATAVAVYQWGWLKAERAEPAGGYTATALVRWQTAEPAQSSDGLLPPPPRPDPREIRRQLASEANLRRAVRELGTCPAPLSNENDETTFQKAVEDVRQNLRVVADAGSEPGQMQVSITCTQRHPQYATLLVNALAERCAGDYRTQWQAAAQQAYGAAQEVLQHVEQDLRTAKADLEEFSRQHLQPPESQNAEHPQAEPPATASQGPPATAASEPASVENPEWVELSGQLEGLQRRRAALLVDRTPEHPTVQEVDLRIVDLTELLATKPRWIAAERSQPAAAAAAAAEQSSLPSPPPSRPPGGNPPVANRGDLASPEAASQQAESAATLEKIKAAVDRADQARDAATRRERQAWQATLREPQIEVQPAISCETPLPSAGGLRLLLAALASGLVVTAGIAMISAAVSWEPTLNTLAEVEALLPVPVVGIIPASAPAGHRGRQRPLQSSWRVTFFVGGLLVVAFWVGLLLLTLGGH